MTRPLLLLVDDSPEMGLIVRSLTRRAGWDVSVVLDAEAAWQALGERRPDLVLLDVNLPGPSGLDWLRRVRRAPEGAGLRVALYTHWGLPADVAAGLDAGVDFVFDKDLATRPADWRRRLTEVSEAGREGGIPGAWPKADPSATMKAGARPVPPVRSWAAAFNQALRHPSLRRLSREVSPAVWRRSVTAAIAVCPRAGVDYTTLDGWLGPDGFEAARLPPCVAPELFANLAFSLAEQIGRLLGDEAAAAFRGVLAAAPGVRELLRWE